MWITLHQDIVTKLHENNIFYVEKIKGEFIKSDRT